MKFTLVGRKDANYTPPEVGNGRKGRVGFGEDADLKEVHHVVGAELQVDPSDGDVLPGGSVSSQVHRHQLIQASA